MGSLLDFSVSGLIAGFIFGIVGLYLFRQGKKRANFHMLIIGILLMIYPYFTAGPWQDWGIGLLLCGGAWHFWDRI